MSTALGHPDRVIYLDYHASTPIDPRVLTAMMPYFTDCFGNPHAADHAEGWRAHKAVENSARRIASALQVDTDEVIFTSSATESNNLAILGLARRAPSSRRRILVSAIEHKCVLAAAEMTAWAGCTVEFLPVDRHGVLNLDALQRLLRPDVLLVSVMAVNNEIGTIQPMAEVARLAHAVGAYVHTDAAQAVAAGPLSLPSWDVDLLSLSGHKIYGPKGIGALFIRREVQSYIEPLMYGGGQQNGLRSGTLPVPLCVGLAEAVDLMNAEHTTEELKRIRSLRDNFVGQLKDASGQVHLNGPPPASRHPGNANLRFSGYDAQVLLAALQPRIAASTGSACTSGVPMPSHVLRAIGLNNEEADSSLRFGIGRFTTETDIHEAVALIRETLNKLGD